MMRFVVNKCKSVVNFQFSILFSHLYYVPLHPQNRGVAQLVAFLVWDQAVAGSSPVTSTNREKGNFLSFR